MGEDVNAWLTLWRAVLDHLNSTTSDRVPSLGVDETPLVQFVKQMSGCQSVATVRGYSRFPGAYHSERADSKAAVEIRDSRVKITLRSYSICTHSFEAYAAEQSGRPSEEFSTIHDVIF